MGFKEDLRHIAEQEIEKVPTNYRCHEGARVIGGRLNSLGLHTVVKDGVALYDVKAIQLSHMQSYFPEMLENLSEDARNELLGKGRRKVLHSWCEIDSLEEGSDRIIVDWNGHLRLSNDSSISNVLVIENISSLPHRYVHLGRQVGNWIIFGTIPPIATKLRI